MSNGPLASWIACLLLLVSAQCISLESGLAGREGNSLSAKAGRAGPSPRFRTETGIGPSDAEIDTGPGWHSDYWEDDPRFPSVSFSSRDPPWNTNFREEPRSRVLLYPAKKLAFCYIEKVACTQFNHLFNKLNGLDGEAEAGAPWWLSAMPAFGQDFTHTTREQGWTWATFIRDPLPRYLSAWGSKCVQKEDDGSNCVPSGVFSEGAVADFEENVRQNYKNPEPMAANPHWASQTDFCGGINASNYDFIGYLRGNVTAQVLDMLHMVGATDSYVAGYVQEFFPVNRIEGHSTGLDPHVYYQNVSIQRVVKQMYRKDFRLPGVLPSFIQPAAGAQPRLLKSSGPQSEEPPPLDISPSWPWSRGWLPRRQSSPQP